MPLVLILYLGAYVPIVALSSVADAVEGKPALHCWRTASGTGAWDSENRERIKYIVPGWRWLIPYPFRKGKVKIALEPGDKDACTGETFNGNWWYRP